MSSQHIGAIVELSVKQSNISITELARRLQVSRRTLYYWFSQESLSYEIVYKIGKIINFDFTTKFPELTVDLEDEGDQHILEARLRGGEGGVMFWIRKYVTLLEKFNKHLEKKSGAKDTPNKKTFFLDN